MLANSRIALIRLSSVGDVLHSTPVARAIKKAVPSCHLTWIVGKVSAGVLANNPYIDEIYVWSREYWESLLYKGQLKEAYAYWNQLRQDFRSRGIDIALDIHGLFLSGMVTLATGAKRRIGLSGAREFNSLFTTETAAPVPPSKQHKIDRYLSILKPLGIPDDGYAMTLVVPPAAKRQAQEFLRKQHVLPGKRLIAINPRTTWPAKNWPLENFAAVADSLGQDGQLLLCGSPGDREAGETIIRQLKVPVIDTIGRTSLPELAALLSCCHVLFTGDTGPLHMATAMGIPTVSLFGPTDPAVYGPLTPGHIVLRKPPECGPCNKQNCPTKTMECMLRLTPQDAVAAVREQLYNTKQTGLL